MLTLVLCSELLTGVVPYTDLRAEAEVSPHLLGLNFAVVTSRRVTSPGLVYLN